jgi:hypothetical protein
MIVGPKVRPAIPNPPFAVVNAMIVYAMQKEAAAAMNSNNFINMRTI